VEVMPRGFSYPVHFFRKLRKKKAGRIRSPQIKRKI